MVVTDVLLNILAQFVFFFVNLVIFLLFGNLLFKLFIKLLCSFKWFDYTERVLLKLSYLFATPVEYVIRIFFGMKLVKENGETFFYKPKIYNPWQCIGKILTNFTGIITGVVLIAVSMRVFVPNTFEYVWGTLDNLFEFELSLSNIASLDFKGYTNVILTHITESFKILSKDDVWGIVLFAFFAMCAALAFGIDSISYVFKNLQYLPCVIVVSFASNFIFALVNYDIYSSVARGVNVFGIISVIAMTLMLCAYATLILIHVLVFLVTWPFRKAAQAANA